MDTQQMPPLFPISPKVKRNKTENTANEKHETSELEVLLAGKNKSLPLTSDTKSTMKHGTPTIRGQCILFLYSFASFPF